MEQQNNENFSNYLNVYTINTCVSNYTYRHIYLNTSEYKFLIRNDQMENYAEQRRN